MLILAAIMMTRMVIVVLIATATVVAVAVKMAEMIMSVREIRVSLPGVFGAK